MIEPDPRPDLLDSLLRSCWTVEVARAELLHRWGGEFAPDGDQARRRADIISRVLDDRDLTVADEVVTGHTAWLASVMGEAPDKVPLGPAVVHRLAAWNDTYAAPWLDEDADRFVELGQGELRIPITARHTERDETLVDEIASPDGERFVVFTDIHIGARGTDELARRAVADINAVGPSFVVVPGDITDDGEPEQFERAKEILDGLDTPYHCVLGNHDSVRRTTMGAEGHDLFERTFGKAPSDVVLDCGPMQVALVDTTDPVPSPFPDWDLARGGFREDAGGTNGGALRPGQAEALAQRLDPDRAVLVVCHHELQPFYAFPPVMFGMRDDDSRALAEALSGHRLLGLVAGHTHRSALSTVEAGISQLEIPSLKDWPFTYSVVTVTDGGVHVGVRQISDADMVWEHAHQVPPIYLGYVVGPQAALEHTFAL